MPRSGLSRADVIEKAASLANEKGLNGVTVTSLSQYLGIRKPSLYYHVQTVDEVIEGIMVYGWRKIATEVVPQIKVDTPEDALKRYAVSFYHFAFKNPGIFEAMLTYNRRENNELNEVMAVIENFFYVQSDKMQIDRETAKHLLRTYRSFLEGFLMLRLHRSFGEPVGIPESFAFSMEVLLKGMDQYRKSR